MRIERITARGMKMRGQPLDVELTGGRAVLTGANGSGKTTALQAVQFAATGSVDGIKRQDISSLASHADGMAATITLSGKSRFTIQRRLVVNPDGTTKTEINLAPSRGERGLRAAEERIRSALGSSCGIVDPGAILAATPGARAQMILDMAAAALDDATGPDRILGDIDAGDTPQSVVDGIRDAWSPDAPLLDNLSALRKVAAEYASEAEQSYRRALGAAERLRAAVPDAPAIGATAEERVELAKRLEKVTEEVAAARDTNEAARQAVRRVKAAEESVAATREGIDRALRQENEASEDLVRHRESLAAAESLPEPVEPAPWQESRDVELAEAAKATESARRAWRLAKSRATVLDETVGAVVGKESCPTCRQSISESTAREMDAMCREAVTAERTAHEECNRAEAAGHRVAQKHAEARKAHDAAVREYETAKSRRESAIAGARAQVAAAQRYYDAREVAVREARTAYATAVERMREVEKDTRSAPSAVSEESLSALRCSADRMRDRLREIDESVQAAMSAEAAKRAAESAGEECIRLDAEMAAVRSYRREVDRSIADMTASVIEPFSGSVNGLLAKVRDSWRIALRPEGRGIEIRVSTDGGESFRAWESLSGGEAVAFTAALALAVVLIQAAPSRWLLVEGAELDADTMRSMLSALDAMGEEFDTILVAHHTAPDDLPETWQRIEMGARVPEEMTTP